MRWHNGFLVGLGLACATIEMFVLKLQPMIYGSTVPA